MEIEEAEEDGEETEEGREEIRIIEEDEIAGTEATDGETIITTETTTENDDEEDAEGKHHANFYALQEERHEIEQRADLCFVVEARERDAVLIPFLPVVAPFHLNC